MTVEEQIRADINRLDDEARTPQYSSFGAARTGRLSRQAADLEILERALLREQVTESQAERARQYVLSNYVPQEEM